MKNPEIKCVHIVQFLMTIKVLIFNVILATYIMTYKINRN